MLAPSMAVNSKECFISMDCWEKQIIKGWEDQIKMPWVKLVWIRMQQWLSLQDSLQVDKGSVSAAKSSQCDGSEPNLLPKTLSLVDNYQTRTRTNNKLQLMMIWLWSSQQCSRSSNGVACLLALMHSMDFLPSLGGIHHWFEGFQSCMLIHCYGKGTIQVQLLEMKACVEHNFKVDLS
jgi:hypothetical protein